MATKEELLLKAAELLREAAGIDARPDINACLRRAVSQRNHASQTAALKRLGHPSAVTRGA